MLNANVQSTWVSALSSQMVDQPNNRDKYNENETRERMFWVIFSVSHIKFQLMKVKMPLLYELKGA